MDRLAEHQEETMSALPFYGVGNLTRDPELRFTDSGAAVANLTIASTAAPVRPAVPKLGRRRHHLHQADGVERAG
jgi:hypothetical protein